MGSMKGTADSFIQSPYPSSYWTRPTVLHYYYTHTLVVLCSMANCLFLLMSLFFFMCSTFCIAGHIEEEEEDHATHVVHR